MRKKDQIAGIIKSFILPAIIVVSIIGMACSEDSMPVNSADFPAEQQTVKGKKAAPDGLILNEYNGNYYEAVESVGITWDDALEATEGLSYKSCVGHLATITSQNENDWIVTTFPETATGGYWLGGYQADGTSDPAEAWSWVTNENWIYTNWTPGEPNDFGGDVEQSLHFSPTFFGAGDGTWNDQRSTNTGFTDAGTGDFVSFVDGYVVEYDCGAKVTGSGNRDGDKPRLSFVAQKDANNNVKGQAQVNYPDGRGSFHMAVSCLSVWGNEAWLGGNVTSSSFDPYPVGTQVLWSVADNGQGNGTNDATSFYFGLGPGSNLADFCDLQRDALINFTLEPLFVSTTGNIQIH